MILRVGLLTEVLQYRADRVSTEGLTPWKGRESACGWNKPLRYGTGSLDGPGRSRPGEAGGGRRTLGHGLTRTPRLWSSLPFATGSLGRSSCRKSAPPTGPASSGRHATWRPWTTTASSGRLELNRLVADTARYSWEILNLSLGRRCGILAAPGDGRM